MTAATEDRIARLLLTFSVHCGQMDLTQIGDLLRDLAQVAEGDERRRVLGLVAVARRRIHNSRGRIWAAEVDLLMDDVQRGTQQLFDG